MSSPRNQKLPQLLISHHAITIGDTRWSSHHVPAAFILRKKKKHIIYGLPRIEIWIQIWILLHSVCTYCSAEILELSLCANVIPGTDDECQYFHSITSERLLIILLYLSFSAALSVPVSAVNSIICRSHTLVDTHSFYSHNNMHSENVRSACLHALYYPERCCFETHAGSVWIVHCLLLISWLKASGTSSVSFICLVYQLRTTLNSNLHSDKTASRQYSSLISEFWDSWTTWHCTGALKSPILYPFSNPSFHARLQWKSLAWFIILKNST